MEGGPPMFRQNFTCSALLESDFLFYLYGTVTHLGSAFQTDSSSIKNRHWPGPRSLATTNGVSVDVLSSGYLDVSVPRVRFLTPIYSAQDDLMVGFPHSEIHGSKPAHGSPWLIAACHVLHRLSMPRHSPDALKTLDCSHYPHLY